MKTEYFPKDYAPASQENAERIYLLPEEGQFYKVGLHTHTTCSDGRFTPEEIKEIYASQGYSAVAYTDHRNCIPHPELTDESFVALTGIELDFNHRNEKGLVDHTIHLNGVADDPLCSFVADRQDYDLDFINKTIAGLKEKGCFVTLNHPVWSGMSTADVMNCKGMDAIEVYNSVAVWYNNYSDDSSYYEYYLRAGGPPLLPVAADDCHRMWEDHTPQTEYFKGWCMVKAPELSYGAIMNGLKQKNAYASTGPEFKKMWIEGDMLHVECSPVSALLVHCSSIHFKCAEVEKEDVITEYEINIGGLRQISPYIWVQLRDNEGHAAWSCPYFF